MNDPTDAFCKFVPPIGGYHLSGGLFLLSARNSLSLLLSSTDQAESPFSLLRGCSVPTLVRQQAGIRVLGRIWLKYLKDIHDPVSNDFVLAAASAHSQQSLSHSQFLHWRGMANALNEDGHETDALIASRVDSQIRLCTSRFERLCIAYRTVRTALVTEGAPRLKRTISDKYAQYIGGEYRSLLNELYSLRDALLSAAYRLRYEKRDPYKFSKAKQAVIESASPAAALIREAMFRDDGNGLIEKMSLYRSVTQHCLGTNNPLFGDAYKFQPSSGPLGEHAYLTYPLYDNIERLRAIERGASQGLLGRPDTDEIKRFLSIDSHLDALEFTFDSFHCLLRIAEALSSEINIQPRTIRITDEDIHEATVTNTDGSQNRMRRDPETGALIEY